MPENSESINLTELDLEATNLDMSQVNFTNEGNDRYVFLTQQLITARKIAWEIGKHLVPSESMLERLRSPQRIDDYRLDGVDTSYSEETTAMGETESAIYLRQYVGKEPFSNNLKVAVDNLFKSVSKK